MTDGDIERSQAFLGAVRGPREITQLDNNPPEPIEAETAEPAPEAEEKRVTDLIANTDKWLAEYPIIEDEEVGAAAADCVEQLEKELKAAQEKFRAEKEPHEEKLREIRAKYHPWIDRIEICLKTIRPRFRAWIKLRDSQLKAKREAEDRAAAEAQRRADQLTEQAQAGGPNAVAKTIIATEAAQEAERARQAAAATPQRAQVRGNLGGRTHSLRTVWEAEIFEQDLCYVHFRNHAEVKDLLKRLANAAARHGVRNPNLPGCWISSKQE